MQGHEAHKLKWPRQRDAMFLLGNTMSIPVLEQVLHCAMSAIHPTTFANSVPNRWLNYSAQEALIADAQDLTPCETFDMNVDNDTQGSAPMASTSVAPVPTPLDRFRVRSKRTAICAVENLEHDVSRHWQ